MSSVQGRSLPTDRVPSASVASAASSASTPNSVRKGARFDAGSRATVAYPSIAGLDHSYALTVIHEGAAGYLIGDAAGNQSNLYAEANGDLVLRSGTTDLQTYPGALTLGTPVRVAVSFAAAGSSATVSVDSAELAAASFGPIVWGTRTSRDIGSRSGAQEAYTGVIFDVEFTAGADDTNTAVFTLDGSETGFLNSAAIASSPHYTNSTVADATVTGLVQFAQVLSSDGGKPVPVGRVVLVGQAHHQNGAVGLALTTRAWDISTVSLDEAEGFDASANSWTAPFPGVVEFHADGLVRANTILAADILGAQITLNGVAVPTDQRLEFGVDGDAQNVAHARRFAVSAGDVVAAQIVLGDGINTYDVWPRGLGYTFYPTI